MTIIGSITFVALTGLETVNATRNGWGGRQNMLTG